MKDLVEKEVKYQYLKYDFTYEGRRHKGKIRLVEDAPNVIMWYDDHDIEITWVKRIRHKGKYIEINIVINDDVYDANEGKVVASGWVCVYALRDRRHVIDQFEPDCWLYIDEENESNTTCRGTFYEEGLVGFGCLLCSNPDKCKRR